MQTNKLMWAWIIFTSFTCWNLKIWILKNLHAPIFELDKTINMKNVELLIIDLAVKTSFHSELWNCKITYFNFQ